MLPCREQNESNLKLCIVNLDYLYREIESAIKKNRS